MLTMACEPSSFHSIPHVQVKERNTANKTCQDQNDIFKKKLNLLVWNN